MPGIIHGGVVLDAAGGVSVAKSVSYQSRAVNSITDN